MLSDVVRRCHQSPADVKNGEGQVPQGEPGKKRIKWIAEDGMEGQEGTGEEAPAAMLRRLKGQLQQEGAIIWSIKKLGYGRVHRKVYHRSNKIIGKVPIQWDREG